MRQCTPLELADLDLRVRQLSDWHIPPSPEDILRSELHGLAGAIGVMTFHRYGRVREAALRLLLNEHSGIELAFLLIRLDDWVQQVRELAERGIIDRIHDSNADQFLRCLPLVLRLSYRVRFAHGDVLRSIFQLLRSANFRPSVLATLQSTDRHLRRAAFHFIIQSKSLASTEELEAILNSSDSALRTWAAREMLKRSDLQSLPSTVSRLEHDSFTPIRREALWACAERLPQQAIERLKYALLDSQVSMREGARFYLRNLARMDYAAFYAERLAEEDLHRLGAAIAGLGETGAREQASKLVPFTQHESSRIRRAAIRAIARLDDDAPLELLLTALSDASGKVVKAVRNILLAKACIVGGDRLMHAFDASQSTHSRCSIVVLIAELQWWDAAGGLLTVLASKHEDSRELAAQCLLRWRGHPGRLTVRPTAEQFARFSSALDASVSLLVPNLRGDFLSIRDLARRQWFEPITPST